MKYVFVSENGIKLIPDREKLSWTIDETPANVSFTVTPWSKDTDTELLAHVACHILGCEEAAFISLECALMDKPLHEELWNAFVKKLK